MESYNLADAKAHLSDLVERAAAGEEIEIRKRGQPMVKLVPVERKLKPIDLEALRRLRESMPAEQEGTDTFIRRMRDESRY